MKKQEKKINKQSMNSEKYAREACLVEKSQQWIATTEKKREREWERWRDTQDEYWGLKTANEWEAGKKQAKKMRGWQEE